MKLVVTGSPGVGKTTQAKLLAERLGMEYVNEKDFAIRQGIGGFDEDENEYVIGVGELEKGLNGLLKEKKNLVIEGHLVCEARLEVDAVVVVRLEPELLELRLEQRSYSQPKIQDNVFCEGIDYCLKHAKRAYPGVPVIEVESRKSIKETNDLIIKELEGRGIR